VLGHERASLGEQEAAISIPMDSTTPSHSAQLVLGHERASLGEQEAAISIPMDSTTPSHSNYNSYQSISDSNSNKNNTALYKYYYS
jgi:hypothetical protein